MQLGPPRAHRAANNNARTRLSHEKTKDTIPGRLQDGALKHTHTHRTRNTFTNKKTRKKSPIPASSINDRRRRMDGSKETHHLGQIQRISTDWVCVTVCVYPLQCMHRVRECVCVMWPHSSDDEAWMVFILAESIYDPNREQSLDRTFLWRPGERLENPRVAFCRHRHTKTHTHTHIRRWVEALIVWACILRLRATAKKKHFKTRADAQQRSSTSSAPSSLLGCHICRRHLRHRGAHLWNAAHCASRIRNYTYTHTNTPHARYVNKKCSHAPAVHCWRGWRSATTAGWLDRQVKLHVHRRRRVHYAYASLTRSLCAPLLMHGIHLIVTL